MPEMKSIVLAVGVAALLAPWTAMADVVSEPLEPPVEPVDPPESCWETRRGQKCTTQTGKPGVCKQSKCCDQGESGSGYCYSCTVCIPDEVLDKERARNPGGASRSSRTVPGGGRVLAGLAPVESPWFSALSMALGLAAAAALFRRRK
ncbi:MAG: hypothetical protein GMKNLPBB_02219 [Myxococcota bacterium]|nr:hypothetical protein [Myxococcota bacterium]